MSNEAIHFKQKLSVALIMADWKLHHKLVTLRHHGEQSAYLVVPKGTRNGTIYS